MGEQDVCLERSGGTARLGKRERTVTLHLGVPPEQLPALAACSASEAGVTGALAADLWDKTKIIRNCRVSTQDLLR